MAVAEGAGFPVAVRTASASPQEVRLVENLYERFTDERLKKMIGDKVRLEISDILTMPRLQAEATNKA